MELPEWPGVNEVNNGHCPVHFLMVGWEWFPQKPAGKKLNILHTHLF